MNRTRKKLPGSIRGRIESFFATNPTEEMRVADFATKFDTSEDRIRNAIRKLPELERVSVVRLKTRGAQP